MVVVSNVEILGKPKYRPTKVRICGDFNPLEQLKSKQSNIPSTYLDLVYERDGIEENQAGYQDV